jgi:hypothetical protein
MDAVAEKKSEFRNQEKKDMIGSIGGIVLIVLGAVFLLNNLGIAKLPIRELAAKWWPAILILVGVSLLTRRLKK